MHSREKEKYRFDNILERIWENMCYPIQPLSVLNLEGVNKDQGLYSIFGQKERLHSPCYWADLTGFENLSDLGVQFFMK